MKDVIQDIFKKVQNLFIYQPDTETYGVREDWRSHADAVEQGIMFRDDCDGFAMTCAELLHKQGIKDIRLVFCHTENGIGHLVCYADGWVLDNRQRVVMNWEDVPYTWAKSMELTSPGVWRKV